MDKTLPGGWLSEALDVNDLFRGLMEQLPQYASILFLDGFDRNLIK
jgi:hypothetical protein